MPCQGDNQNSLYLHTVELKLNPVFPSIHNLNEFLETKFTYQMQSINKAPISLCDNFFNDSFLAFVFTN